MFCVDAHTSSTHLTENASSKSERKKCTDLKIMYENRLKPPRNPLVGCLNIYSLRNKIVDTREVFGKLQLDYFVLSQTKLDDSFPSAQFYIENFEIRNWRDRDRQKWRWAYRICKKRFHYQKNQGIWNKS